MDFMHDTYIESLYQETIAKQKKFKNEQAHRAYIQQGLVSSLGMFPVVTNEMKERQPVLLESKELKDYIRERVAFQTADDLWMPVYILTPKNGESSHPAVLALHGHGCGSREIVGLAKAGEEDRRHSDTHQHFAVKLVKQGLKVFVPEIIGFGDRMLSRDVKEKKPCSCESMATNLLMAGRTLAGIRVFEAMRVLDLMNHYRDVKGKQTGVMGFSGGGVIAAYTAVLDQRIRATVLSGFVNTFKGSIMAMHHCIDNYLPGILTYAELPDILTLLAPRHLFVEAGCNDPIFPIQHVKTAVSQLEKVYQKAQKEHAFTYDIFEGSHEISGRNAYDWLRDSLKQL